jgi:hypothetical protein
VTTVAIMQPYFFPYAGYYRLAVAADVFVIYDCVQFPRRGRVHRCELADPSGRRRWLTIPLARQPRTTLVKDVEFADCARREFDRRLRRYPWLCVPRTEPQQRLAELLHGPLIRFIDFLDATLRLTFELLALTPRVVRSSTLRVDASVRGQDRILAIARAVGATRYVNAPGGTALYDRDAFAAAGLELDYLSRYQGPYSCMLAALFSEPLAVLRDHVRSHTAFGYTSGK